MIWHFSIGPYQCPAKKVVAEGQVPFDLTQTKSERLNFEFEQQVCQSNIPAVKDWQAVGLDLPSWIDTGHILYLSRTRPIQKIGTLLSIDREKLTQFLRKRNAL